MPGEGAGEYCLATMVRHLHSSTVAAALSALAIVACQQQYSENWTGRRHSIPAAALLVSIYAACYACCKGLSCACAGRSSKHAYKHVCSCSQAGKELPAWLGASAGHLGYCPGRASMPRQFGCSTIAGLLTCSA